MTKPPAPYFGGKTRIAPWLITLMGPHERYVEPFVGTAAVLLAKPPAKFEVINDVDGDLVTFFRVLRDRPDELERACRLTPYARDEFMICRNPVDGLDDLERARRWWVRVVQGFNNAPGKWTNGWSISPKRGCPEPVSAVGLIARFEAVAARLQTVAIENADAAVVIERFDDESAVIYCDPPYLGSTRSGRERRNKGTDYMHDMTRDEDHIALAEVLGRVRGHVLLSGYASPLYTELYAGWWRTERRVVRNAANLRANTGKSHAIETVWSNRPLERHLLSDLEAIS